jgi:hypothetical protein
MSHKIDTMKPSTSIALDVVDDRFEPIAKRGQIVIGRYDACGTF